MTRVVSPEVSAPAKPCGAQHCVGCPAVGRGMLESLLKESSESCGFDSLALEPRAPLPPGWLARYSFAMVRRGYLIRQRTDSAGRTTAIDAVGPGCCFPLDPTGDGNTSGYALTRALVCLSDSDTLQRGLLEGGQSAAEVHQLDAEAIVRLERLADARGRPGAASKVAALLCTLSDTLKPAVPGEARIPLEFLQRDLAALLSIRHESVCRVMRDFTKRGYVTREPDGLALANRPALQAL